MCLDLPIWLVGLEGHRPSADLTLEREKNISHIAQILAVIVGKFGFYTLNNPSEIPWKLAPSGD